MRAVQLNHKEPNYNSRNMFIYMNIPRVPVCVCLRVLYTCGVYVCMVCVCEHMCVHACM